MLWRRSCGHGWGASGPGDPAALNGPSVRLNGLEGGASGGARFTTVSHVN